MKPLVIFQKVLVLGLVLVLCASMVGVARAAESVQNMINAAPDGGTVNIPAGTYNETLLVDKNLTLKGVSLTETILQPGASNHRVIKVTAGHNLRLEYLRVTGGHPDAVGDNAGGGVYLAGGSLELDHVQIDHNQASYGGGVFQESLSGTVTTSNVMIDNNMASIIGGGVYSAGSASLSYTILQNNSAANHGGGIHVNTGTASLTGGAVTGNHAQNGNGGGVNVNDGLNVVGTTFNGNTAAGTSGNTGSGGAITQWNSGKVVSISQAVFNGNSAQANGGALYIRESFLSLGNSTFTGNYVDSGTSGVNPSGGGVFAGGGLDGTNLIFTTNSAKCTGCSFMCGGGLFIQRPSIGASSLTLSTFDGNFAWLGSGIFSTTNVQLTLTKSSFINNGSLTQGQPKSGYGGGVDASWVHGDQLLFQNNKVLNFGGGMKVINSVLTNSRFFDNTATSSGGGVYSYSNFSGTNLLFTGNEASLGMALYVTGGSAVLWHATISRPTRGAASALFASAGSTLEVKNSIISSHDVGIRAEGTVTEDYNLYFNNRVDYDATGGTINFGNHNVALKDPLFVDPANDDYHLLWPSPAIGKGTNLDVTTDLDGRFRLGRMDIGAYQFWANLFVPLVLK